jgi:hypothetical protein
MNALDGLTHIEPASVMQFVKMHATMARANHEGSDGQPASDLDYPRSP